MGLFISLPTELLSKIVEPVDVGRLHVFASANRRLRDIVKTEVRRRVYNHLTMFVPKHDIPKLLTTLTETSSVIGGSVAQAVITPSIFNEENTANLNIFVADGFLASWESFLEEHFNFSVMDRQSFQTKLIRTISTLSLRGDDVGPRIVICESSGSSSIIPVIGSAFTSQMNFLTASHIYSIYPRLTMNMKAFHINTMPLNEAKRTARLAYASLLKKRGVKLIEDNEQRDLCKSDKFCSAMTRFIGMEPEERERSGADDIGILCWGDDANEEEFLEQKRLRFWLGGYCVNKDCTRAPRNL